MGNGGPLWRELVSLGGLIYRWLLTFLYWLYKVSGKLLLMLYGLRLAMGRRRHLTLLGSHVYGLHRKGAGDWPVQEDVRALLNRLDAADRKRKDLEDLSWELDEQYRERVERAWRQRSRTGKAEAEITGG
jgi:hypothetical protein